MFLSFFAKCMLNWNPWQSKNRWAKSIIQLSKYRKVQRKVYKLSWYIRNRLNCIFLSPIKIELLTL
jgi:hypothetical protein